MSDSRAGWCADGVRAEDELGHGHAVRRVDPAGHRAHEGLVAVLDVAVDHVQVARVRRQVRGLDDGAARVVDVGAEVRQLDEVAEVLQRRLAAAARHVVDEGRPIDRRKAEIVPADDHVVLGVARQLGELAGRQRDIALDQARGRRRPSSPGRPRRAPAGWPAPRRRRSRCPPRPGSRTRCR